MWHPNDFLENELSMKSAVNDFNCDYDSRHSGWPISPISYDSEHGGHFLTRFTQGQGSSARPPIFSHPQFWLNCRYA
jgi:hypothetical protein